MSARLYFFPLKSYCCIILGFLISDMKTSLRNQENCTEKNSRIKPQRCMSSLASPRILLQVPCTAEFLVEAWKRLFLFLCPITFHIHTLLGKQTYSSPCYTAGTQQVLNCGNVPQHYLQCVTFRMWILAREIIQRAGTYTLHIGTKSWISSTTYPRTKRSNPQAPTWK